MELIGAGRDADVWALDSTRVLRRYRHGGSADEEARVMAHLAGVGFAVPRVHDVNGADLVMDRLTGPTMAQDLARRPWRAHSTAGCWPACRRPCTPSRHPAGSAAASAPGIPPATASSTSTCTRRT